MTQSIRLMLRILCCLCVSLGAVPMRDSAAAADETNYLPPGTAEMRHLCLLYHGQARRTAWTAENLRPYVACLNAEGQPVSWLFDSFLFIEFATDAGAQLYYYAPDKGRVNGADWVWLAESWFRAETGLIGLERCVAELGAALNDSDRRVNVVITLPVPLHQLTEFSGLPGVDASLDLSREEDRRRALTWYMNAVSERFAAADYRHLRLLGFYWTGESVSPEQHETVRWTADWLHVRDLRFFWIPYFTASGVEHWRELGFDAMMLQPNYFFDGDGGLNRLMLAARRARLLGSGVEMEFDGRVFTSDVHYQRYWDYLDAGAAYGWMTGAVQGWYEGGNALGRMMQEGERGRSMYEALCRFVQGAYIPHNPERFPVLIGAPTPEDRPNLALASRGATVRGAIDDGRPGLAPERLIDGQSLIYTGESGFAWFAIPGSLLVEFPEPVALNRTRTLFFDLDGRTYAYRMETSIDGEIWEGAVDKSEGAWGGWQVDDFPDRMARFCRITGLHNSTGQTLCQIVEFEAYGTVD